MYRKSLWNDQTTLQLRGKVCFDCGWTDDGAFTCHCSFEASPWRCCCEESAVAPKCKQLSAQVGAGRHPVTTAAPSLLNTHSTLQSLLSSAGAPTQPAHTFDALKPRLHGNKPKGCVRHRISRLDEWMILCSILLLHFSRNKQNVHDVYWHHRGRVCFKYQSGISDAERVKAAERTDSPHKQALCGCLLTSQFEPVQGHQCDWCPRPPPLHCIDPLQPQQHTHTDAHFTSFHNISNETDL